MQRKQKGFGEADLAAFSSCWGCKMGAVLVAALPGPATGYTYKQDGCCPVSPSLDHGLDSFLSPVHAGCSPRGPGVHAQNSRAAAAQSPLPTCTHTSILSYWGMEAESGKGAGRELAANSSTLLSAFGPYAKL